MSYRRRSCLGRATFQVVIKKTSNATQKELDLVVVVAEHTDRQARLHGKRITRVTFQSQLRKKCRSLLEINCSQGETALCCAMLALSGTDTLVSLIPRPVPGHKRWTTVEVRWVPHSTKKKTWTRRKLETKVHCFNRIKQIRTQELHSQSLSPKKNRWCFSAKRVLSGKYRPRCHLHPCLHRSVQTLQFSNCAICRHQEMKVRPLPKFGEHRKSTPRSIWFMM